VPKRNGITGARRKLHNKEFMIFPFLKMLPGLKNEANEMSGACSTYGREAVHTGFWCENLGKRYHMEDLRVNGSVILKRILKKSVGG